MSLWDLFCFEIIAPCPAHTYVENERSPVALSLANVSVGLRITLRSLPDVQFNWDILSIKAIAYNVHHPFDPHQTMF